MSQNIIHENTYFFELKYKKISKFVKIKDHNHNQNQNYLFQLIISHCIKAKI